MESEWVMLLCATKWQVLWRLLIILDLISMHRSDRISDHRAQYSCFLLMPDTCSCSCWRRLLALKYFDRAWWWTKQLKRIRTLTLPRMFCQRTLQTDQSRWVWLPFQCILSMKDQDKVPLKQVIEVLQNQCLRWRLLPQEHFNLANRFFKRGKSIETFLLNCRWFLFKYSLSVYVCVFSVRRFWKVNCQIIAAKTEAYGITIVWVLVATNGAHWVSLDGGLGHCKDRAVEGTQPREAQPL